MIKVGQVYVIHTYLDGGKELAKVIDIEGRFFKKYKCMVWGVHADGSHHWPNGHTPYYENYVSKKDLHTTWGEYGRDN